MDRTGQILDGRYRLLRRLGTGPAGLVYEAARFDGRGRVAVKVLHPDLAADQEFVRAYVGSAWAASATGLHGVVETLDVGHSSAGAAYLVTELVQGDTLAALLADGARLPAGQAVEIAVYLLTVLVATHARGIIHGNLSPTNVVVVPRDDGTAHLRLLDFGRPCRTSVGRVLGRADWTAPEVAAGRETAGPRADVYSVGSLLYTTLTGTLPFGIPDGNLLAARLEETRFPDPREADPSIHPGLAEVIAGATATDPAQRYPSAAVMRAALARFLAPEVRRMLGVEAPPPPETPTVLVESEPEPVTAPVSFPVVEPRLPDVPTERAAEPTLPMRRPEPPRRPWSPGQVAAVAAGPVALLGLFALITLLLLREDPPPQVVVVPMAPAASPSVAHPAPPPRDADVVPDPAAPDGAPLAPPPPPPAVLPALPLTEADASGAPPVPTVTITVAGLPPDLPARAGDQPLVAGSAEVPRGTEPVPIRVGPPGAERLLAEIVPDDDAVLIYDAPTTDSASAPPGPERDPGLGRPPTPSGRGRLGMACTPFARVAVPGHGTHNTPFALDLPAGTHRLVLAGTDASGTALRRMMTVQVRSGAVTRIADCW